MQKKQTVLSHLPEENIIYLLSGGRWKKKGGGRREREGGECFSYDSDGQSTAWDGVIMYTKKFLFCHFGNETLLFT